ncbi:MAG: GTPase Era, partial [Candidatus Eremiobacterota bacterium]
MADATASAKAEFRSGLATLVGKPNVGKSTLLNALVGSKVAITSSLPQTTRRRILGVVHRPGYQVVLVDTPGITVPRHELGRRMAQIARTESQDADVVLFLADLTHPPRDEDRAAAERLRRLRAPVLLVGTKVDLVQDPETRRRHLGEYAGLGTFAEVLEVSAVSGQNLEELLRAVADRFPEGPPYYPEDQVSDQNQRLFIEEVIREKVLSTTRQEVPHAVAVQVEEMRPGKAPDTLYVAANLYVERDGQKAILIGKGG